MKKRIMKISALILALAVLFLVAAVPVGAAGSEGLVRTARELGSPDGSARTPTYSLKGITNRSVYAHATGAVYLNSSRVSLGYRMINGVAYLPFRAFIGAVGGISVVYNSSSRTITATGGGHNISVSDGAYALYANGRVLFSDTPSVILSDGRMYVPVSTITKALSLNYYTGSDGSLRTHGTASPILSGASYYDADAVYWLSRIISAESRGESLIGQIAVGNVVLNRTRHSAFPNTIWGVIFDRKYGVQFSPVSNGTIYNTPAATSVLAAKICLDGFTVSDDVLYFLRPSASTSSWIVQNREFLFVIGNHYFFA